MCANWTFCLTAHITLTRADTQACAAPTWPTGHRRCAVIRARSWSSCSPTSTTCEWSPETCWKTWTEWSDWFFPFTCTKMDYTSHAKGWLTIWQGVCHSYLFIALDNDDWNSLHGKCFGMAQRELWIMNEQKWNDKIHDRKKSLSIYFAIVKLDSSPNVHNVSHGIRWD